MSRSDVLEGNRFFRISVTLRLDSTRDLHTNHSPRPCFYCLVRALISTGGAKCCPVVFIETSKSVASPVFCPPYGKDHKLDYNCTVSRRQSRHDRPFLHGRHKNSPLVVLLYPIPSLKMLSLSKSLLSMRFQLHSEETDIAEVERAGAKNEQTATRHYTTAIVPKISRARARAVLHCSLCTGLFCLFWQHSIVATEAFVSHMRRKAPYSMTYSRLSIQDPSAYTSQSYQDCS